MNELLKKIINNEQSFVLYQLPKTEEFTLIYGELEQSEVLFNEENFIVQPFHDQAHAFKNHKRITLTGTGLTALFENIDLKQFLKQNTNLTNTDQSDFENFVSESVTDILAGKYHKIVPSKVKTSKNNISSVADTLKELTKSYPEALVTFLFSPDLGCWLGASPEVLLKETDGEMKTAALAGTQVAGSLTPKQASWSQKEIEEQALVSRYIIDCFKIIRLREYTETGPKTMQTGKLFHLKTDYTIHKNETDIKDLESKLISLLHPTSAVCGMPKDETKQIITQREKHDRALYTGFWGPVSTTGFGFYVNIRLAQIFKEEIVFYAGAGVTEDSDPLAEWKETESKCDNLAFQLTK